ncbi:hypothetical protein JCM33374_g2468 [Metschnikowia sp. JCM 33374]|nr:hypothetical protein JCM33374_g2468 [Metschnikowia sp. JCM 33374]
MTPVTENLTMSPAPTFGAAASRKKAIWAFLALLATSAAASTATALTGNIPPEGPSSGTSPGNALAAPVANVTGETLPGLFYRFDDMETAIDTITEIAMDDPSANEFMLLVDNKVVGIRDFTVEYDEDNSTEHAPTNSTDIGKRWNRHNAPLGASWTEEQTAQQGTWMGPWYPASCVHQNELGDTPIVITLTQAMTYTATFKAGFNLAFGKKASLDIGLSTTESNSRSESRQYTVPPHSYGQVWQQQLMVWQDQQNRRCKKHHYQKGGIKCKPWSEYIRGDLPVTDGVSFGWSTGKEHMNFNSCGGGT